MRLGYALLSGALLATSFLVIQVTYEVRVHYQDLQMLRNEHKRLATRNGQLQLEVGALQALPLVEQLAATQLRMYVPAKEELILWLNR